MKPGRARTLPTNEDGQEKQEGGNEKEDLSEAGLGMDRQDERIPDEREKTGPDKDGSGDA